MRLTKVWRAFIFTIIGIFFLVPIVAMAEFSTRGPNDSRSLEAWKEIPSAPNLLE
jgi:putative spermidine/putrescine transport system permease protein